MWRFFAVFLMFFGSLGITAPQNELVNFKVRVLIVDKELNRKPVPFLAVTVRDLASATNSTEIKTDLDGNAETKLKPGRYSITTAKPVELGGKSYTWNVELQISGVEQRVDLTNDNAKIEDIAANSPSADAKSAPGPGSDLSALFDKLKYSVVAVHGEAGKGSGFLVDPAGLVVTNNHVVASSGYLAVQFDEKHKVAARLLAANPDKDVAVLWANLSVFPEFVVAPMISEGSKTPLMVGQRVFTIGNPFGHEKVLTTGVISKIEKDAITSDIMINPGNSGGPLFTMNGQAAGLTTALQRTLASIVPVENVRPMVEQARKSIAGGTPPSPVLLPVEPSTYYPADALREMLRIEKLDTKPYFFDAGEFYVALYTPPVNYYLRHEQDMAAARKNAKRSGGDPAQAKPPDEALHDAQDYRPVLLVRVRPKFGAFFKVRFKNGFTSMRLLCGGKEVTPIEPGRSEFELHDLRGRTIDTTYQGFYSYQADAVSPACGNVTLEIFSEKDPNTPIVKPIEAATIDHVWADFDAYRKAQAAKP